MFQVDDFSLRLLYPDGWPENAIRNCWRFMCDLVLKVIEKGQKKVVKVAKYSTFCVFLLQQKVNGTH